MAADIIAKEIALTNKALEANERLFLSSSEQQQQQEEAAEEDGTKNQPPILERLQRLQQESDVLSFAQAVAHYVKLLDNSGDEDDDDDNDRARLTALADILCDRTPPPPVAAAPFPNHQHPPPHHHHHHHRLYWDLYEKEFLPLHQYLLETAIVKLRTVLKDAGYPQNTAALLRSVEDNNNNESSKEIDDEAADEAADNNSIPWTGRIAAAMDSITNLRALYRQTRSHVQGQACYDDPTIDPIVVELCRPLAERLRYFFVVTQPTTTTPAPSPDHNNNDDAVAPRQKIISNDDDDNNLPQQQQVLLPTHARIDRLPEWCLSYVKTHIFGPAGPWEYIWYGLGVRDQLAFDFVNEILRLIQYVLVTERNFFRHPHVIAHAPVLLTKAIDQLLQFDHFIATLLLLPPPSSLSHHDAGVRQHHHQKHNNKKRVVVSLIDVCVAGDEELLQWWLERERDSVFGLLRSDEVVVVPVDDDGATDTTCRMDQNLVSPRAELFCALLRSLQEKSAVFSFSQPYLQHVAAPLCVQFLDALHAAAAELREALTARRLPADRALAANIRSWLALINGAHMAVQMLLSSSESSLFAQDDDMVRLGRSLERLRAAMLDDFITDVVETVLMERTKLAGYLMRCSHLLSMDAQEVDGQYMGAQSMYDMSVDLMETKRVLSIILAVCDRPASLAEGGKESVASFAPTVVRERVLSVLAEKFLEVALDLQGMTPDLRRPGCALFARDVRALFDDDDGSNRSSTRSLPKHPRRVMDIASLMERKDLAGLGNTLCNLCGRPAPLTEAIFESDGRLYEEAMSMIRAKGHMHVELADVFAVLNRRRDL